jgi:hypothetical protein
MNRFNFGRPVTAVRRKIILGNPKKDCDHMGICYVTDDNDPPRPGFQTDCPLISGVFSLNLFGQLRIVLAKKDLTASLRMQHFSSDKFTVVEPFVFSPKLAEVLSGGGKMTVRPGRYDWEEDERGISISIPLLIAPAKPAIVAIKEKEARPQVQEQVVEAM